MSLPTAKVEQIAIEKLRKLQVRAAECQATVETYIELYARKGKEEVQMPALSVFKVGDDLHVVDGNHRLTAAELARRVFLPCVIVGSGSLEDAKGAAIKCNHDHGLRRSIHDKRQSVRIAFDLGWFEDGDSGRHVAKLLHLSHTFVNKQRKQYEAELNRQGGNVSTQGADHEPEQAADGQTEEPTDDPQAADSDTQAQAGDARLANDYATAASGLQRVYDQLCDSLGSVNPVCVKVNEAKRLAEEMAEQAQAAVKGAGGA